MRWFSIGGYDPSADSNSMYSLTQQTGAQTYWQHGYTGQGVGVAVIDTGVAPVEGLIAPGKVALGPDLSFDSPYPALAEADGFGHGTHIAGIIAGRDSAAVAGRYAGDSSHFIGMAPDARILSVKVGDHTGAVDVTQVIAAIDWVVQHRNDNGMNVRVLNLSFGTIANNQANTDPLAYAAEQAWKHGIVVVAAAGNDGAAASDLADPAYDPYVLAVGAADTRGQPSLSAYTAAAFSSVATGKRNPDIVAPGVHVASLRDPGSSLDTLYGSSATVGSRFFRGSGTSQATAVVSGAAALVISQHPTYGPDQVKQLLVSTALNIPGVARQVQGQGELNLTHALGTSVGSFQQNNQASDGVGGLDGARGALHLVASGVTLAGDKDIFGRPFDATRIANAEATATSWTAGTWNGSAWSGSAWSGSAWSGSAWSGSGWSGSAWSGVHWSGSAWSGSAWSGSAWSGSAWSGSAWSGSAWSGSGWSGSAWFGSGWSDRGWLAARWS